MSFVRPFFRMTSLVAAAALVLLTPLSVLPARAQGAQAAPQTGNAASVDQANPSQQKSLTTRAVERVQQAAKSASDIFSRVPCLPPKGGAKSMGSLPHEAGQRACRQTAAELA